MKMDNLRLDRRHLLQMAAAGTAGLAATALPIEGARAQDAPSEVAPHLIEQLAPSISDDLNTADIIVETLIAWGATHAFGVVGDGINAIIEALRKRQDRIRYVGVRHEEAAAFMASGFASIRGGWASASARPGRVPFTS